MRDPQELRFRSRVLQNERILWLQPPPDRAAVAGLVVLLDGEYHVGPMDSPRAVAELQRAGRIPPVLAVYVSHLERDTRWRETRCNPSLAAFLADELRPWACAQANVTPPRDTSLIGGLSLTGLAAAHAALLRPEAFGAVLAQSGSFWWRDGQLAEAFRAAPRLPLRFHLSCGERETAPYVEHGPDLIQRISQLDSNRAFRDTLVDRGYPVAYLEIAGGHEPATWAAGLPGALVHLLGSGETDGV